MEFKEMQEEMIKSAEVYGKKHDVDFFRKDFVITKFLEESGELAQAILIHERKCRAEKYVSEEESIKEVGKELADVVGVAVVIARLYNIDLEEAIRSKWMRKSG